MFELLKLLPIGAQVGLALGIISAIGGGVTTWSIHEYDKGYQAAILKIAAEDKEAIDAANEARSRVRDCVNSGGVWDTADGICGGR